MSRAQEPLLTGTVLAGVALVGVLQSKETAGPRSLPETITPVSAGETMMSGVYLDVKDYFSRFHVSLCPPTLPGMVQRVRRGLENGTALTPAPLRADQAVSRSKGNRDRLCMTELLSLDMWALAGRLAALAVTWGQGFMGQTRGGRRRGLQAENHGCGLKH